MSPKDQILAELDEMTDAQLARVLDAIRRLLPDLAPEGTPDPATGRDGGLMARLRAVEVDGPLDLAANHDAYATGFDAGS